MSRNGRIICSLFAIIAFVVLLLPIVVVVGGSFDGSGAAYLKFPPSHLSISSYLNISASYFESFFRSLLISGGAATLSTILGLAAAISLSRSNIGGKGGIQGFFQLPLQIPFVVIGVMFLQTYHVVYDEIGLALFNRYSGLILAHLFFCIPYSFASVTAVVTPELKNLENAARLCGATERRVLSRITIPALMPGVFSGLFYAFIVSFGDIPVSIFLSNTAIQPLSVQIFQTLQFDFDPSVLAVSTLVIVFSVGLVLFVQKVLGIDLVRQGARS